MSPAHVRYEPTGKRATPSSSLQREANDEEDSDDEVLGSAEKKTGLTVDTTAGSRSRMGKKRNIAKTLFKTLPTPAKSSQMTKDDSTGTLQNDSDESDIRPPQSTRRSSGFLSAEKKGKRTGGLDGAADSSAGSTAEDIPVTPTKMKKKARPTRGPAKKTEQQEIITLDSDSEPEVCEPQPTRLRSGPIDGDSSKRASRSTKKAVPKAAQSKPIELSGSEDELQLPKLKNGKGKGKATAKSKSTPKLRKSKQPAFIQIPSDIEDQDEDDDDPIVSSPKRSQRPLHKPGKVDTGSESESDDIRSSPLKRRKLQQPQIDEDEPILSPLKRGREAAESDNSDIVPSPMKRRRPAAKSDSDSDLPSINKLYQNAKGKQRARSVSGPPETPMLTRQARGRKHRTAKEKQMELLKRRRAGENIEELTESESEEDNDDEDEFQKLDEFDDEEESPEQPKKSSKGKAKVRRQRGDSSDEEAGESDFVVDEGDGPLGVPDYTHLIPLEFTQAAHKPMSEHFRDVVEWMVQNKLNPGFTWNDPVYNRAFDRLDAAYLGFAKSKFVSTQWTAEFTRAVYARPIILISKLAPGEGISALGEAKCEPCNHRNHHPSYALQFTGKPYHKATLEEIDSDSDDPDEEDEDEDGSDSDRASVNSQGMALCSVDKIWMSGSVCKQNAEQAHTLIHWRWHLNDWVLGNLEEQGFLKPAKLAAREKLSTNKRMKLANSVVDQWESDGIIKTLYQDFKVQGETARELKAQARGGWK